jgi:DNA-binding response OmpR family regulator
MVAPHKKHMVVRMATILIADDNVMLRQLVGVHMAVAGHRVLEAGSGREALEQIERHSPELILLDHMMPEGDGPMVLREVRRSGRKDKLPVIMLTARSASEDKVMAFKAGADDYVVKPFDANELTLRVWRLLHRSAP